MTLEVESLSLMYQHVETCLDENHATLPPLVINRFNEPRWIDELVTMNAPSRASSDKMATDNKPFQSLLHRPREEEPASEVIAVSVLRADGFIDESESQGRGRRRWSRE